MSKNIILNEKEIDIILQRLACQLIENHQDFSNTILIGLQPRGKSLLNKIVQILTYTYNISDLNYGLLDITFYRDDFRRNEKILEANSTDNLQVEGKNVVFMDDVLFTGRTIRAALTAVETFGDVPLAPEPPKFGLVVCAFGVPIEVLVIFSWALLKLESTSVGIFIFVYSPLSAWWG